MLQHGQSVKNEDGVEVKPEQVGGLARNGPTFSFVTDTMYHPTMAPE